MSWPPNAVFDGNFDNDQIRASRIEGDLQGVTTVLLVSARPGKSVPPVGLLTKTARTFVQDGASTEFATQVLGTTLDNGRLYARILSTSSRVFYDKEPSVDPTSPYVVYPSRTTEYDWQSKVDLSNAPIKAIEEIDTKDKSKDLLKNNSDNQRRFVSDNKGTTRLDDLTRENDIFSKRELGTELQRFKPVKVRPADNLPTYTVKQEYVSNNYDFFESEQPKTRTRLPKIFKPTARPTQRKADNKPLATVTYHGFADFTTTVGDTVIVFSPSTSPAPVGRPATTIKGDATLRPDDGIAVVKIRPTVVSGDHKPTDLPFMKSHNHIETSMNRERDELLDIVNGGNIQPSVVEEPEVELSSRSTDPLLLIPDIETNSIKPTGLLKVIDSMTSSDGTTTRYKSLIYGTYIGTDYAQVIHTSSNVYFFPNTATITNNNDEDTTVEYEYTNISDGEQEQDTTVEMTIGTTPQVITTSEEASPEMNELTTPLKDTTDSVLTTLKDILESARKVLGTTDSALPTFDDGIPNDILSGDPQGRSIKGGSSRNEYDQENNKVQQDYVDSKQQVTFATKLLPSTVYETFTYYTTFFIPDSNGDTTTSVKSREVVSSEVTFLTELITPSSTESLILPTKSDISIISQQVSNLQSQIDQEQTTKQDEEIELIFKTLYTTYTYLTTFFQKDTSSISSREVVETNVITQTVGPNGVSAAVASLFEKEEPILITPTEISQTILPSVISQQVGDDAATTPEYSDFTGKDITEGSLTTILDDETTITEHISTVPTISEDELEDTEKAMIELEASPTPAISTGIVKHQLKTYYTTYTYFTTTFVDDETEIETRTEVFTNVVTETIQPSPTISISQETTSSTLQTQTTSKPAVPPEILAYLEALQRQKSQEEAFLLAKKVQAEANASEQVNNPSETTLVTEMTTEEFTEPPTTLEQQSSTENILRDLDINGQVTPNPPINGEILGSMITDVLSSSSSGGGTVLDIMDKRNAVPEDQELSESNHQDVEPPPTLLLQTSYTTFTYFTTMYKGDTSNVASRLETVTNVVTETIRPTVALPAESSTLPVTYFTTFTYWTTFYKGGDTLTTSREETVSTVVTPDVSATPTVQLEMIMTYRPDSTSSSISLIEEELFNDTKPKITADNEVAPSDIPLLEKSSLEATTTIEENNDDLIESSIVTLEPTTFYTTYTYFTTTYAGNETILNSRLETVTSVFHPNTTEPKATGRAIGSALYPGVQGLETENKSITPSKAVEIPKTGLISTIRSSKVQNDVTTHYMTDVYGTIIDGLYAQVMESSTSLETASSLLATPVLPTGVLSLNKGSVVDADGITTVYFTTKQIGTSIDGVYAKVIENSSSTKIDEAKKQTISSTPGHRTGLVRLIEGQIENDGITTYYQSKVIGTSIEGRYAQIIESTSSFASSAPTLSIAPTSTLLPSTSIGIIEVSPSPAVIQSSLSEDSTTESPGHNEDSEENEENEEEDDQQEDDRSSRKKSRLTFSSRKKSFTPVIIPFASRNRPTFNPKRKGAQGATTITRTDITPTITATLAGKGNRFASSRGRVSSPIGPYSSTVSPSSSRRFSGRRNTASATSSINSATVGGRGRGASRISPSSVLQGNRRAPATIRGSSRGSPRGSSSIYPGASSRYRPGIRASSTLLRGQSTIRQDDQDNDANEFTTTTLVTEETPYTQETDEGETVTIPLQTTTESSRRSTNPLLRFRRPINFSGSSRASTTPKSTNRNNKSNSPSIPNRNVGSRLNNRPTPPTPTRSRQTNAGFFPPRGYFSRKQESIVEDQIEDTDHEEEEDLEEDPVEEIADNDYEGSEHEDKTSATTINANRRFGKTLGPVAQIRPFGSFSRGRRVRRQANQLRSLTSRFRKSKQPMTTKTDETIDVVGSSSNVEDTTKASIKPVARYSARTRTSTGSRPNFKPSNNPEKSQTETTETSTSQSNKANGRTKQSTNGNSRTTSSRIKPSPTSGNSRQFTLREKDSLQTRSTYKRSQSSATRTTSRPTNKATDNVKARPPRLRTNSGKSQVESINSSRRVSSSRATSRTPSRTGSSSRRTSQRGRTSHEDIRESPIVYPDFDGTITVTHYVPTEVTIPVVNNGVTEQRNIITAQPSTEVLGPSQYSTVTGGDGRPLVVIVSEATGINSQGQTEITRFLLHETPTTRVSHTLTTFGGRRASQSVIVPTTVYSVENVVSTIRPSLPTNPPLANILLSQLLLGQLNPQNQLLQPQGTPTTQYNTRTTTYVTTITKHQSTVIPLTFRGKEILTTLIDSSSDIVTATEFITDTVVVTPTATLPAANLNSLLLLLQQPQQQIQPNSNPLLDPLFAAVPLLTQSNTLPGEVERRHQPADSDYKPDSYEYSDEDLEEYEKPSRVRGGRDRSHDKKEDSSAISKAESSVVTLYVSGRRPGEFSTVLSTVKIGEKATASRRRRDVNRSVKVQPSIPPSLHAASEPFAVLTGSDDTVDAHTPTQSLESVVGEQHNGLNDKKNPAQEVYGKSLYDDSAYVDNEENQAFENSASDDTDEYPESRPRKRVRIRIPIVRSRVPKKHKLTVVRRRPLTPSTRNEQINRGTTQIPKRIVTRVRALGLAHSRHSIADVNDLENITPETPRHKITITRRRKLEPTVSTVTPKRVRITRKKLVAVRPIEPTPTLAIITTGFFTAPSDYSDEYDDEENTEENIEDENHPTTTPSLEETPNVIESKPEEELNEFKSSVLEVTSVYDVVDPMPVIITDNFFFPPSDDEEDENYEDNYTETTTSDNLTTDVSTLLNEQNNTVQNDTRLETVDSTTTISDISEENLTNPVTEFETLNEDVISNTDTDTDVPVNTATLLPSVTIKESTSSLNEEDANELAILHSNNETSDEIMEITTSLPEEPEETTPLEQEETTLAQEEETTSLEEKETTPVQEEETTVTEEKETTSVKDEEIISLHDKEILAVKTNDAITEITLSDISDISISADKTNTTTVSEESIAEQSTTVSDVIEQPVTTISETIETSIERNSVPLSIDNTIKDFDSTKDISTSINDLADTNQILNPKEAQKDNEILTVKPIQSYNGFETPSILITVNTSKTAIDNLSSSKTPDSETSLTPNSSISSNFDNSYIPSVIPLNTEYTTSNTPEIRIKTTNVLTLNLTKTIPSPTPEDIEAGLVDDLYLSLSRPDFPEIVKSKSESIDIESKSISRYVPLEPSTSIYYTETIVTSTRLRTYTYIVTKLNGLETQVTSSTTIRPRVTTLTLTVPITVTVTPTMESSVNTYSSICNAVSVFGKDTVKEEEEGRKLNLATRVMSNGVEVIVAGPTPALRWENSNPQPTLTLSDAVVMLLPQEKSSDFVTKTCTTTFTYFGTINNNGNSVIATEIMSNAATEEHHKKTGSETASVFLEPSPTLHTEVLKTTYTYLTVDKNHANMEDSLISSTKVVTNKITAPQHYLHMMLEPSEVSHPETNTYLSTKVLEKTYMEDGHTKVQTSDKITQLITTESGSPPKPTSVITTLTALDSTEEAMTDIMKTYYITYTYYNTFFEKGTSVIRTNVATSTNVVLEKIPTKDTSTTKVTQINATPEPIQIFATKTYLTTFTYFTTLLQAGPDGETSTTISSRSHIIENVVTESIAPSLLDAGYMNALLTTAYHSDPVKNVVTGSTIIFFDEEDQIDPTTSSSLVESTASVGIGKVEKPSENLTLTTLASASSDSGESTVNRVDYVNNQDNNVTTLLNNTVEHKRPSTHDGGDIQLSNLLHLGSLGINGLSALKPVITAMAGLLQGKTATRRNDTEPSSVTQETTTQRSPIYIPVAEFADDDIEVAESQNIAAHLVNPKHNHIAETRHKVTSSLADGIPISPGEVITANSDVIIGKPGKMAPRPPQNFVKEDEHIGMKPPPLPVPNIPVHPVLEILENNREDFQEQHSPNIYKEQLQIIPSHRIYEEHLKIPLSMSLNAKLQVVPTQPQKLHPVESVQTNKIELKHDPLLKPPDKPGTEKLINKQSEWSTDGSRGPPWGATNPLTPPALPVTFSDVHLYSEKPVNDKSWPTLFKQQKHPNWAQKDSFLPDGLPEIQTSETQSSPSEPIVHQVPHIIDRSTGQPLLVNIQPSQVANVMIPQDGTQALIFGDTGERHISGQYFDDPSPYPEPETGPGFVGIQKAEDLFQNLHGKDPLNYMVPPSPPSNFKPAIQKTNSSNRPHIIRLPQVRFDHIKPPGKLEPPFIRSDKRPADIHMMKQPHQSSVTNGQGFVHSEILVHHRPETLNLQLASHTPMISNGHPTNSFSSNGQFVKNQKPMNTLPTVPSRRAESTIPTEIPHIYSYHNKPDSGNEVISNTNWKLNKKPPRITLNNRLRPQSVLRPTTHRPHNRPAYIEKPVNSVTTKTTYPASPKLPFKPQNTALLPHQISSNTYLQYEYSNKPISIGNKNINNVTNQGITHNYQVNFQDRLPQTNPEKTNLLNSGESITKWNHDQAPIGAIEYHNPSYLKIKSESTGYHSPMLIVTSKNHTIDSIHFDAQNKSRPLDSEIAESEHIKSHENIDSSDINYEKKLNAVINLQNNKTTDSKNNYGMINTDKPSYGKPSITEQSLTYNKNDNTPILHPGEPFKLKNNSTISANDTFYGTKTYEIPVVKSKPHKMYGGNANRDKHHEYREKESEFDYKTVQESSPIYLNDQNPLMHHNENVQSSTLRYSYEQDDTIDLKPPAIIPQFRPIADHESTEFYSKPHGIVTPETRPTRIPVVEIITKPTDMINVKQNSNISHINNFKSSNFDSFLNQNSHKEYKIDQQQQTIPEDMMKQYARPSWNVGTLDTNMYITQKKSGTKPNELTNYTIPDSIDKKVDTRIQKLDMKTNHPSHFLEQGLITGIHPEYPHIITKPKLQVPDPVVISSTAMKPDSHIQSNVQFSMPVEITDDEQNDSKTQTERPPSMLVIKTNSLKNKNQDKEMLETAYQTNFASLDSVIGNSENHKIKSNSHNMSIHSNPQNMLFNVKDPKVPSRDMMPPPLNSAPSKLEDEQQKLKPPPPPSNDVLGLSPPPLEITTTYRPMQHRPDPIIINEPDLKLSSKYIPLKELTKTMVPQANVKSSNLRTTITKSFLPEQLSERMVPSPPALQTKSFEISTTKIGILPFGSTQKPTASISNVYINQYIKSKYATTQNTIKPSIMGTPILRASISTKGMEHSSDPGVSVQQIAITTTKTVTSTQVKSSDSQIKSSKPSLQLDIKPTKSLTFDTSHTSVKLAEQPIFLQSSHDYILPSVNTEPTESLTFVVTTDGIKESSTVKNHEITKTYKQMNATTTDKIPVVAIQTDKSLKSSDPSLTKEYVEFKINETTSVTVKPNVGTVIYENVSDTNVGVKPKEIVRIKMSTLTKIETFAVGLPPTTRTFLLTHTMTSTTVETVTETFLHPTNTLTTMTSNILQSMVTRLPSIYENSIDNDSIFVVMSDQKPPEPGAEEVEAEYGEEDISRDEQNPTNNEIHRVLAGGILGAPIVPLRPTNQCTPECKGSKAETCVEVENEMRCVCRPGFARMFPDRPCKPTYTYTLHVGLDRIGHEPVAYQESLNDSTSLIYRRLAGSVKDALDRTLMQSDLRDIYRALKISKFTSDPVKVVFHVQLSDNANETRLKEVLRKYLVGSNYSLGGTEVYASKNLELIHASDFDECSIEEDGPHHDCSPNAACFNLRGSYQCSCKEGWADLSENPAYPGRICSQAPIGCAGCNNKGHCVTNIHGQEICECFPWYSGQRCQVNLKVMLIALVTTGAILLGLLAVCVGLACFRQPVHNKHTSGDTRAMISGAGGDTSSEDSVGDVTIPYHVPHVLPPPPQMIAPLPPMKRPIRKISEKSHHPPRKPIAAASEMTNDEQRDRSLTVMIPRAKYRSAPQSPQNYKTTLSTFVTDEHKLINYLDNGSHHPGNRKQSISSTKDCKESDLQTARAPAVSTGALVSAGFQVSATVTRMMDAESTLARSCGETTIEPPTKVLKNCDSQGDLTSTLARSCGETTIQTQTKLLRQDLAEAGSILARSCEETTIQPFTKIAATRTNSIKDTRNNKNSRDNGSEGHTMAERDLGSTLRLPPHHPPLYSPDRV
uniref:63 kDa sperm flagellar membrane protein n=1 Tax=Vespula pensylvanica TaxID=30213 RepID=A0A834KCM9_VESPE|nr:hypothetical protein H0235_015010 [Vespula pensylvanica]